MQYEVYEDGSGKFYSNVVEVDHGVELAVWWINKLPSVVRVLPIKPGEYFPTKVGVIGFTSDDHLTETFGPLETDPTGRGAHDTGAKLDHGKIRVGLVLGGFSRALMEVCEVGTGGAVKYSDNGWVEVPNGIGRYTDALGRHLLKEAAGELTDGDTDLHHAAHAAWNALARLELILREGDDINE